jgi:hypothetical protein
MVVLIVVAHPEKVIRLIHTDIRTAHFSHFIPHNPLYGIGSLHVSESTASVVSHKLVQKICLCH